MFMTDVCVTDVKYGLELPVVTVNPALRRKDSVFVQAFGTTFPLMSN